jgi:hypothetical protein
MMNQRALQPGTHFCAVTLITVTVIGYTTAKKPWQSLFQVDSATSRISYIQTKGVLRRIVARKGIVFSYDSNGKDRVQEDGLVV